MVILANEPWIDQTRSEPQKIEKGKNVLPWRYRWKLVKVCNDCDMSQLLKFLDFAS